MKAVDLVKGTFLALLFLAVGVVPAQSQTLSDYSALPPFLGNIMTPNVLILMDNSGSMDESAYHAVKTCAGALHCYDYKKGNNGYFNKDKCYVYGSGKFSETGGHSKTLDSPTTNCGTNWDGNFLNYLVHSKVEITKWVMVGGRCSARTAAGKCLPSGTLVFDNTDRVPDVTEDGSNRSPHAGDKCFQRTGRTLIVRNSCGASSHTDYDLEVVPNALDEPTGVIQEVGAKARFGLMEFKGDTHGGNIVSEIGSTPLANALLCGSGVKMPIVNAIECTSATTWTPLAESLYEATRYYAQIQPQFASDYTYTDINLDPYYFKSPTWAVTSGYVTCCKSFVIIFTDGEPTKDLEIPDSIKDYAHSAGKHGSLSTHCGLAAGCTEDLSSSGGQPKHSNTSAAVHNAMVPENEHHDNCSTYFAGPTGDSCLNQGSHYLDDVAYWAHTTDLRAATITGLPDTGKELAGFQNLNIYTFFAFGSGSRILRDSAKLGGFIDLDGDNKPFDDGTCLAKTATFTPNAMCKEWDKDGDGVPDTYFESDDADAMKERMSATITDILQKSASGTSVSVLATSSSGEGAIYQAYFYPSVFEGIEQISWLGYLQGLFFDTDGQLREDTNGDGRLILNQDKIVETYFDSLALETRVRRYDVDANGKKTGTPVVIGLKEMKPIWEGGKVLAKRDVSANPRKIYTWVDIDNNGAVPAGGGSEFIDFTTANFNSAPNMRYLRAASSAEATDIVNFIRGGEVSGFRNRKVSVDGQLKTWPLGDIIYSSPTSVGSPQDRFDLKNQDSSYNPFYSKYKDRRHVVYVGANDGMLHAFNAGFFHQGDDPSTGTPGTPILEHGYFTTTPTGVGTGKELGEELWAFIPQELLPHLKWLTGIDYDSSQHVYYVDGTPRVVDAQIFSVDAAHPGGWGTVLIGSMRLGGGLLKTDLNGDADTVDAGESRFRSAYFAFDITDPEAKPTLLWVYKENDLGFTTSWPSIMRFNATTWYLTFGSGPIRQNECAGLCQ
jgi:type IV pilus assembly protein PilY1